MRKTFLFLLLLVPLLLLLSGCAECKQDDQCESKKGFNTVCIQKECVYTQIGPGVCGNAQCESAPPYNENECTCAVDCGPCAGSVEGSSLLKLTCNENRECLEGIPLDKVSIVPSSNNINSLGNTFRISTEFNNPVNIRKDTFDVKISLQTIGRGVSDIKITKLELSGQTPQKTRLILSESFISRRLYQIGDEVEENLVISFPTSDLQGKFTNLELKINYDYVSTIGTTPTSKSGTIKNTYRSQDLDWAKPKPYLCTDSQCEQKAGFTARCITGTSICEYSPIANACGNFACEGTENKCSCPIDCGTCSGDAGTYTSFTCDTSSQCIAVLKSGFSQEPISIFDDKNLISFHLQNNYKYKNPLNINTDTIDAEITLFNRNELTSNVKVTAVRVFEGTSEVGGITTVTQLNAIGQTQIVSVPIFDIGKPEDQKVLSITIYYQYTSNNEIL